MKVMIAIRISGTGRPQISRANTSLGLGQGAVVDMRTVMYDSRKQVKMKVSLSRKFHIMTFPQDTFLNDCWSELQSDTMPGHPSRAAAGTALLVYVVSAISDRPCQ